MDRDLQKRDEGRDQGSDTSNDDDSFSKLPSCPCGSVYLVITLHCTAGPVGGHGENRSSASRTGELSHRGVLLRELSVQWVFEYHHDFRSIFPKQNVDRVRSDCELVSKVGRWIIYP